MREKMCKLIEIWGDESIQAMMEGCKSKHSADNTNTFIRYAVHTWGSLTDPFRFVLEQFSVTVLERVHTKSATRSHGTEMCACAVSRDNSRGHLVLCLRLLVITCLLWQY